jgi:ribonuclease III
MNMSKRSYQDYSAQAPAYAAVSISGVLEHADKLLRAARALHQDLEAFRDRPAPQKEVLAVLHRHNQNINTSAQFLAQTEVRLPDWTWIDETGRLIIDIRVMDQIIL